jgi:predicted N-formylglutamate amidohydrolase
MRLDAPAFLATYSRLLIDLNRPLNSITSIPTLSEATEIPGNIAIGTEERRHRAERIFEPFHARIADHLDRRMRAGRPTPILTVHSFVPVFLSHLGLGTLESCSVARKSSPRRCWQDYGATPA